jgi:hypothetical protein
MRCRSLSVATAADLNQQQHCEWKLNGFWRSVLLEERVEDPLALWVDGIGLRV